MTNTFKLKFREEDTEYYNNWLSFYPKKDITSPFRLQLKKWGYFDPRPQFNANLTSLIAIILPFINLYLTPISILFLFWGWGSIYLRLPFDTGMNNECENPEYGLMTYGNPVDQLWVFWGKKRKHIELPWSLQWHRTSLLLKDGTWENEKRGDRKQFYDSKWDSVKFSETYPYTYTLKSGEKQNVNAEITVETREWRRNWLPFTQLFNKTSKDIKIEFDQEVGEGAGSYKGGVLGCGYEMKPNETPLQTLQRMSKERKFDR